MLKPNPSALLEWIYPRTCDTCDGALQAGDAHLCWDCRSRFHIISEPFCRICGLPVAGAVDHAYTCYRCAELRPAFQAARSVAHYEGPLREAIQRFKYNDGLWLQEDLVNLLDGGARTLFNLEQIDALTAVPLYPRRQRERGYNQAALLARGLARRLHKPCYPRILSRLRDTRTQTRLTSLQRLSNVRRAFSVQPRSYPAGWVWLLIDDVMTTGATAHACAGELIKAGAGAVYVLTLARS